MKFSIKNCIYRGLFLFLTFGIVHLASAQHPTLREGEEEWHKTHHNRLAFFTGTTLVPTSIDHSSKEILFVPTYGLEYERGINAWLGIGIANEIELQNYVIQKSNSEVINRSFIYVVSVFVMVQPVKPLVIFAGPGYELTSSQNFSIFKVGASYIIDVGNKFDVSPEIALDQIADKYATFTFGISLGKRF